MSSPTWPTLAQIQVLVPTLGFLAVFYQLASDYFWRRRHYAVNMVAEWNNQTSKYRRDIDSCYPGILEQSGPQEHVYLPREEAAKVFDSLPKDAGRFAAKHDITELLNYCEYISVSYRNDVANKKILLESFLETLHLWHHQLLPFMRIAAERRTYNPWAPFSDFISLHYKRCPDCVGAATEMATKTEAAAFLPRPALQPTGGA
jgi:hypothetical protein